MSAMVLMPESHLDTDNVTSGILVAAAATETEWLQSFLDAIPLPVFVKDVSFRYTSVNSAFLKLIGRERADVIGGLVEDVAPDQRAAIYRLNDQELLERGGEQVYESKVPHADGTLFDVEFHKRALTDRSGNRIGILGIVVDITKRNSAAARYEQAAWALNERVKEFNGLARVADIILQNGAQPDSVIREAVKVIPAAFQHPEITKARIVLGEYSSASEGFEDTPWRLSVGIYSGDEIAGRIEVVLTENRTAGAVDEDAPRQVLFLPEETPLLNQMARTLGSYHQAWGARRQSEITLKRLYRAEAQALIGHWNYDLGRKQLYASPMMKKLIGLTPKDPAPTIEEMHLRVHPADRGRSTAKVEATLAGDGPFKDRHRFLQPGGGYRWVEVDGDADFDRNGKPLRFFGTMKDVSDFVAHEEEVRKFTERLDRIERVASVGRWELDIESETMLLSDVALDLADLSGGRSLLNKGELYAHVHPDDLEQLRGAFELSVQEKSDFHARHRFVDAQGGVRWVEVNGQPEFDDDGKLTTYAGAMVDVTRLVENERRMRESASTFRATFDQAAVGICHVAPDGRFIRVNEGACRIWGYSEKELLEIDFQSITVDADLPEDLANVEAVLAGDISNYSMEKRYRRKDGKVIWASLTVSLVRDENDAPLHFISIIQDITSEHEARRRMAAISERLDKALTGTVEVLSNVQEKSDPYTAGHQRRVAELSVAIGMRMGLLDDDLSKLKLGAMIHDLGKIVVPAQLLTKPGELTDIEFELIKSHSSGGYDIIRDSQMPMAIADIVRHHHERWDGSGYPDGLKGAETPLLSRIVGVADTVEAVTSHRPYRAGRGLSVAKEIITEGSGTLFDPEVVKHCLAALDDGDIVWDVPA